MLDNTDVKILNFLKENARINSSQIAEKINMSVSAVIERIKKMEKAGLIRQYTVVVDDAKMGKDLAAYISISLEHPKYIDGFVESAQQTDEILECHYITGGFDFLLKVLASSTEDLSNTLNKIKGIQGVSLTNTLVVLHTMKRELSCIPKPE